MEVRRNDSLEITSYYGIASPPSTNYLNHPGCCRAPSFMTDLNVFSLLTHLIPVRLDARIKLNCLFQESPSTNSPFPCYPTFSQLALACFMGISPLDTQGGKVLRQLICRVLQSSTAEGSTRNPFKARFESAEANGGPTVTNACLSFNLVLGFGECFSKLLENALPEFH